MKKNLLSLFIIGISIYCQAIEDGVYYINLYANRSYVITAFGPAAEGNAIMIWKNESNDNQKWKLKKNSDGTITLYTMMNTNYVLDLSGSKLIRGGKLQLWKSNNTNAQKWRLVDKGGYYYIVSSYNSGWVIDLNNSKTFNGNNLWLWNYNGSNAQKWVFTPVNSKTKVSEPSHETTTAPTHTVQPIQVWIPCADCGGSGRCKKCNGTGVYWYWVGYEQRSMKCPYCNGSCICPICHGSRGEYRTEYVTK